jgi:hypothetical protein
MKSSLVRPLLCALLVLLFPALAPGAEAPREVGGFRLGSSIDQYDFITYQNYLKEVMVEDVDGFRKGTLYYGVCDRPGEIVKITLKYADTSKDFYRTALKQYKARFGTPDRYTGDSFGILKAWKWHFTDEQGNRVSLSLQYNSMDPNESLGTVVKLSLPERIDAERQCFNRMCSKRHAQRNKEERQEHAQQTQIDWEQLLPR